MKKYLSLFLCLLLALGAVGALAAENDLSDSVAVTVPVVRNLVQLGSPDVRSAFPETPDKLVLNEDGVYQLTSKGVTLRIQPPFGVLFLTQDMQNQMKDYLLLNNARGAAETLIANDYNGFYLDPSSGNEILLLLRENALSKLFVNSQENFTEFFATVQTILGDNQTASQVDVNGTSYVYVIETASDGVYHLYYTIKNGVRVALQAYAEEWTEEMSQYLLGALEGITIVE